jgi:HlyD family secretion protein
MKEQATQPARRRTTPHVMRGALALVGLLTAGSAAGRWSSHAGSAPEDVASVTVTKQAFVRRVTAEGTLRAVTGTEVVPPETAGMYVPRKLAWLALDGTAVAAGDIIVRFDPSEAERQLRDAQADLDTADVKLREAQLDAAQALADRDAAATLARDEATQKRQFQATDPMSYSRNEIIEAEIEVRLAAARQAQAEDASRIERRVSRASVALLAIERRRAALALDHTRTALANMVIRAPGAGIFVVRRDDHGDLPKLGSELSAGSPIADIPALDHMEAELFVLEVDAGGLEVGRPAEVVVEARPGRVFHGTIRLVDKLAKPRQPGNPISYVSAVITLDETARDVMKPGQRVLATLVTAHLNALAVPRQAVFEHAGTAIVYRRGDRGWAPVTVELGPATAGRVVVTAGLAEGDVVAERDPTRPLTPSIGNPGSASEPAKQAP